MHVTLWLIGESRLNSSFVGSCQDFLAMYVNYIYDYQEQTSDQPDNQLSEPQVINYLQEALRDDKDLNKLASQGNAARLRRKGGDESWKVHQSTRRPRHSDRSIQSKEERF
jgi:hypothetical protein